MTGFRRLKACSVILLAALAFSFIPGGAVGVKAFSASQAGPGSNVKVTASADSLPCYDIIELSFDHNGQYANSYFDVALEAVFVSPKGVRKTVPGFYDSGQNWKVRFRPDEPGDWTYTYTLKGTDGFAADGLGEFACTPSEAEGFLLQHPQNPHRWILSTGQPFYPIGLQKCVNLTGNQLDGGMIDGEGRDDGTARSVSNAEYFSIYGRVGFNLFRFTQNNCAFELFDDLDHYREAEIRATDELLQSARENGFRVMFGFFSFYRRPAQADETLIAKEQRFIRYALARWGVYVDIWELLNETEVPEAWTVEMAEYVRSLDPDRKPISTSWPQPHLSAIDVNAPHWYESEDELKSDLRVYNRARVWKQAGKAVIVAEQGNRGMNWDSRSGLRMRLRTWTALFQEITFIFWNTSWSKQGMFNGVHTPRRPANIYLGPEERTYIRALRGFTDRLDGDLRMAPVEVSQPKRARAYALASPRQAAVYLHHFENHSYPLEGLEITVDLPGQTGQKLVGEWIQPATGKVLSRLELTPGKKTFRTPPFTVDLALLVTPANP